MIQSKRKNISSILLVLSLLFAVLGGSLFVVDVLKVSGVGMGETTAYISSGEYDKRFGYLEGIPWNAASWNYLVNYSGSGMNDVTEGYAGWNGNPSNMGIKLDLLGFTMPSIPEGAKVTGARIEVYCESKQNELPWSLVYFSAFKVQPGVDGITQDDMNKMYLQGTGGTGDRISKLVDYNDITVDEWISFEIIESLHEGLEYIQTAGDLNKIWVCLATTNHGYNFYPLPPGGTCNMDVYWSSKDNATNQPRLVVTYAEPAAERVINVGENAAVDTSISGDEVLEIIEWGSPRAAFNDESIYYIFYGDSGANVTASMVDSAGVVLDSVTDAIRVDGIFHWETEVSNSYTGWIRAVDNSGIVSTWGRVENYPSATQELLTTSAVSTEQPQYDYAFKNYMVYENNQMIIYWQTNLEIGDMPDYYLKILAGGDSDKILFVSSFDDLIDDYYSVNWTDNRYLAHWRYMIFSPRITRSGYNIYDGMIHDIGRTYMYDYTGFWTADIQSSANETIVDIHSSYFYLNNIAQGVAITIDGKNYDKGQDINIVIEVGEHSKVAERLKNLEIEILDSTEVLIRSEQNFVRVGTNNLNIVAPEVEGNYKLRFHFYDTTLVENYEYSKQLSFGVGEGYVDDAEPGVGKVPGFGDWQEMLAGLLERWGLDNEAGHWLILLILAVIIAFAFRKMPTVATFLIILLMIGGFVLEWFNPWFVVILCLGAGVYIYSWIKRGKKTKV